MSVQTAANLIEVFSSIQGEGLYVGCRQVFVRLAGCNISCRYCDTQESFLPQTSARIELQPGERVFAQIPNPVPLHRMVEAVAKLCQSPHHSVSITGGEPLLTPAAVFALAEIRSTGVRTFLETNGTLPAALESVLGAVDIISMDIKLPSSMNGKIFWQEHAEFLQIAAKKEVYVKVVLTGETTEEEIFRTVELVSAVDGTIPVVLQPVTPVNDVTAVSAKKILHWQALALEKLTTVRVIPQTHKLLGVM